MLNENLLSDKSRYFFEKLLIKTIIYELDWHLILQYFLYLMNNEDKHCDIQFITNLSQLIQTFFDRNNTNQSLTYELNDKIDLIQFLQVLLSFLNQTFMKNLTATNTKSYTPILSSENDIDNMTFLIYKTIRHVKMKLSKNETMDKN